MSAPAPRISVIVPAYKTEPYLALTLDSVLAQTRVDWECIVVDDGSPDAVAEIAQGYADRDPRFRLVRQQNMGLGMARNSGYAQADSSADYVIFLDSDDTWEPDALEALAGALDADPEAAGAHGLALRVGPHGEALPGSHAHHMRERFGYESGGIVPLRPDQPSTLDCLVMKYRMYPPAVVMVRRPLISRAGLWAPRHVLAGSEDWDMFTRVGCYGAFILVDRVIANYRQHNQSLSAGNARGHWWRRQIILRRLILSPNSSSEQARLVGDSARAWGWFRQARWWREAGAALRARQWPAAGRSLARSVFFLLAHLVSGLDLRLHGALRRFKCLS